MLDRHRAALSQAIKARDDRPQWMTLWQELADLFLPNRGDFTRQRVPGDERSDTLWDTGPQLAARGLTSAIATMLRPPGKQWFKAKAKRAHLNNVEAVRLWLYEVTQITYEALYDPRVNADKTLSEVDADLVVFGTGIGRIDFDKAKKHLVIRSASLASTVLFAGKDGNPIGVASFSQPTLRQIVDEFGEDKLTEKMREDYNRAEPNLDRTYEIVHIVLPNADWQAMGGKTSRFPYASMWISVGCKALIDEKGFYDFPYFCPRWDTLTGEVYGRSPAMVALPDSRIVHAMSKTFLEAGEFALRRPTWSYADMIQGELQLFPGGHTVIDMSGFQGSGSPINTIEIGAFPDKIFEVYQTKQEQVAAAFFRDILELPGARDADMTATEINARLDQFLRQAAPIFSRVEHTYNAPLVNRAFNVLMREGMYPDPPEEMWEEDVEFEYESPIKVAREKAEAMKVIEGLQMVLPLAEAQAKLTGGPADILDNLDFDVAVRVILAKADIPQKIMRPIEQMMADREQRQKKIDQMQKAEMASKLAPAAGQIGDTMIKAKEAGMLGFDDPMPIPAPGLMPGGEEAEADILDAVYEEVG
jgi:hypothetical protein